MAARADRVAGAARDGLAVLLVQIPDHVPKSGSGFDAVRLALGVEVDAIHRRHIDDDAAVVADREVLVAMPAAADGDAQLLVHRLLNGALHLLRIAADLDVLRLSDPAKVESANECVVARIGFVDAAAGIGFSHCGSLSADERRFTQMEDDPQPTDLRTSASSADGR